LQGAWVVPVGMHYALRAAPSPEVFVSLGTPRFVGGPHALAPGQPVSAAGSLSEIDALEGGTGQDGSSKGRDLRKHLNEDVHAVTSELEAAVTLELDALREVLVRVPLEQVPDGFERVLEGRMGVAERWDRVRAAMGIGRP